MRIDIVTGLPKLLESPLQESILRRAQQKGVVEIVVHDLRDYAHDKHKTIDDVPYGGGPGMVLKPEPIFECVERLQSQRTYDEVIFLTPDGETFNQARANNLSLAQNLLLLCGHYKGVDERVREALITLEISVGDYVLTGGELAAALVVDAVVRLIPGVLNDAESALSDSFQDGLLGTPQYTRPADFRGMQVPEVLLRGNHKEIESWRLERRTERTAARRQDLLK
jgi:tRNA (guanine37-N1)-methyltransferase